MSSTSTSEPLPYLIETASLPTDAFKAASHPFEPTTKSYSIALGEKCGLTKVGVRLIRLAPHDKSCPLHWHVSEDEWFFILRGSGKLLVGDEGKEEPVKEGDFLAFPANKPIAHAFLAGEEEMLYFCAGNRMQLEAYVYPGVNKRAMSHRGPEGDSFWFADESAGKSMTRGAPAVPPPTYPYRLDTAALPHDALKEKPHSLEPTAKKFSLSIGEKCGLTKFGVNLVRVAPHHHSTAMHWHIGDDEFMFILRGSGALLMGNGADFKSEAVKTGDFVAFPAGVRTAHTLSTGDEELYYLAAGNRQVLDVCVYPQLDKRLIIENNPDGSRKGGWLTNDSAGREL